MNYLFNIGDEVVPDIDSIDLLLRQASNQEVVNWLLQFSQVSNSFTIEKYIPYSHVFSTYQYLNQNWYDINYFRGGVPECVIKFSLANLSDFTKSRFLEFDKKVLQLWPN